MPLPPPPPPGVDPRDIITPEAFTVAPDLLGRPLARPWRRGVALGIDALLVLILSNLAGVLFALAAAWVLFRASAKRSPAGAPRRLRRVVLRVAGTATLFVATLWAYEAATDRAAEDDADPEPALAAAEAGGIEMTGAEGVALAAELLSLRSADSGEEARGIAEEAAGELAEQGLEGEEIRGLLLAAVTETDAEVRGAVQAVADSLERTGAEGAAAEQRSASALARSYAEATDAGDTARAAALRGELVGMIAADTLAELAEQNEQLETRVSALNAAVEKLKKAQEERGFIALAREAADELGLGFGWTALYFTAFLVLWRGQTPGKRLLGIRVLRLDGKPIGWWCSFERFGGYVAGVFTGLLDYFLLVKDRNRQALHDKIVDTVVVWEGAGR